MNIDAIQFRSARSDDRDQILAVHRDGFGDHDGPVIVSLVEEMLDDPTAEPIYSFVAVSEEKIVGHVLFTSVVIELAGKPSDRPTAQILAPLAVIQDLQGKGIGTQLVKDALQHLAAAGIELVFVLGYPEYYSRFGFVPAGIRGFEAPYPIPEKNAGAWMVLELQPGVVETFEGKVKCCRALDHRQHWVE
jgi:predicted N-acetyltransferase YhbS